MADDEPNGSVPEGRGGPYEGPQAVDVTPEPDHSDDPGYITRTRFLANVTIVGGGVLTAAIMVPVVGFAVANPLKEEEFRWVDVGPASDFLQNGPPYPRPTPSTKFGSVASLAVAGPAPESDRRVFVVYGLKDPAAKPIPGANESTTAFDVRFTAWASKLTGEDFDLLAIWNRCAHLGCPVAYSAGSGGYICPCHGGNYDSRGLVTGGPPPRPLDRLDVKVVDTSKTFTPEQIGKGADVVPLTVAAKSSNPNLRVLVGKPYSISQEQQPYPLSAPGEPVTGILANLYPFH